MDTPVVASHFLELLEQSELLAPQRLHSAARECGLTAETAAEEAAEQLVAAQLLTPFQAQRLLAGRARGFFYDRYKVLDAIGYGGMSRIFLAEDIHTAERVALKVLADRYEHDAGMLARLKLEAAVGRRIRHANVLHTERLGEAAGCHFLVMEYVEGVELLEWIERYGPLPYPEVCDILRQAAEGLACAHQAGIVHRDVKPANVLINRHGQVKLLDFGLALLGEEAAEDEFSLSMIFGHNCLGTPHYMPPEQSHDSNAVDATADIYSLGCTLYHALAGRVPFSAADNRKSGASVEVIAAQRTRQPPSIRELVPDLPEALAADIERMMAKRPEDRPHSAADVAEMLSTFAQSPARTVDIDGILRQRINRARKRMTASQSGRSRSGTSGSSRRATSSLTGSRSRPRHAQSETAVAQDTRPLHLGGVPPAASNHQPDDREAPRETTDAQRAGGQPREVVIPKSHLLPLNGGMPIALQAGRIVIGRDNDCDVVLASTGISGRHCELRRESGRWRVVDVGSKNGVQVNGKTVKDAVLRSGDRLTIAHQRSFFLRVEEDSSWKRRWMAAVSVAAALAALGWLVTQLW